jgi:hypothetical protein
MRTRAYIFFGAQHMADFDLTMFGIIRRWCLIGKFYAY